MRRLVLDLLTAVSFVVFLVITSLWLRSWWRADRMRQCLPFDDAGVQRAREVYVAQGIIYCNLHRVEVPDASRRDDRDIGFSIWSVPMAQFYYYSDVWEHGHYFWGFGLYYSDGKSPARGRWIARGSHFYFMIPHYGFMILFGAAPGRRLFLKWRRRRREGRGLCGNCGYDLRACGERCSECGVINQCDVNTETQRHRDTEAQR